MVDSLKYEILPKDYHNYDLSFKIMFIGDSTVGRSALLMTLSHGSYQDPCVPTIGCDIFTFNIKIEDKIIKLFMWDCPGQEKYQSLLSSLYRNTNLVVISYCINNKGSFDNIKKWLNDARRFCNDDCKFFLIGNKADLESERIVSKEEGEKLAKEENFDFFIETSSIKGLNIQKIPIQAAKIFYLSWIKYNQKSETKKIKNIKLKNLPNIKPKEKTKIIKGKKFENLLMKYFSY